MVQVTEAQPGDHGAATLVAPYHEVDQSFWSEIRELKLRGNGETAWLDITELLGRRTELDRTHGDIDAREMSTIHPKPVRR